MLVLQHDRDAAAGEAGESNDSIRRQLEIMAAIRVLARFQNVLPATSQAAPCYGGEKTTVQAISAVCELSRLSRNIPSAPASGSIFAVAPAAVADTA